MAKVRASCPDCGDVELSADTVQVRVCVDDGAGSYAFRCPRCRMAAAKPATTSIVHLLVSWGAPLTMWRLPAELREPHDGPPLTHDDLLSFHQIVAGNHSGPRPSRIDD
jgi:hypothetical protein